LRDIGIEQQTFTHASIIHFDHEAAIRPKRARSGVMAYLVAFLCSSKARYITLRRAY
jgi:hypothetical protein